MRGTGKLPRKSDYKAGNKEADQQLEMRKHKRDAEGRVILQMNVKDDDNFVSKFSENATPVIRSEVAEFIEHKTDAISPKEEFTLRIYNNCIDEQEKMMYTLAIKEYYMQKYIANEQEIKRNRWAVFLLGTAGVFVLVMEFLLDFRIGNPLWTSVIDIVAWVLLWEATDIGVLEARVLSIKRNRYLAYLSMKVEYISIDEI